MFLILTFFFLKLPKRARWAREEHKLGIGNLFMSNRPQTALQGNRSSPSNGFASLGAAANKGSGGQSRKITTAYADRDAIGGNLLGPNGGGGIVTGGDTAPPAAFPNSPSACANLRPQSAAPAAMLALRRHGTAQSPNFQVQRGTSFSEGPGGALGDWLTPPTADNSLLEREESRDFSMARQRPGTASAAGAVLRRLRGSSGNLNVLDSESVDEGGLGVGSGVRSPHGGGGGEMDFAATRRALEEARAEVARVANERDLMRATLMQV